MKLTYSITIMICIIGLSAAFIHSINKQPSKLDRCRAMVVAEVKKNQQFVDAVSPMTFTEALTK